MGTKGKEIVDLDVKVLIEMLNKALADEWLAFYQYWVGAKIVQGPMRGIAVAELEEHANDEFRHAGMLVERILQLDGIPLLKPEDWYKSTNCGYEVPDNEAVVEIIKQNIKGEQCAIEVYKDIVEFTEGKDPITYNMALEILADEVEHEDDLEAILEDLGKMK
jgi:bacterioferritin